LSPGDPGRHEEERVAEYLNADLEPVGRGDGVVETDRAPPLLQHPLADLAPEHEAGLDDARKDEDADGLAAEQLRFGVVRVELLQRLRRVPFELLPTRGARHRHVHQCHDQHLGFRLAIMLLL